MLPQALPPKDTGSPLGFWDYDQDHGWGINLSETQPTQIFLKVPSEWVLDSCRSHRLVKDIGELDGTAMVDIAAPPGSFVPVQLGRYSQRRLKALSDIGAIYRKVDLAERTLSDDSCDTLRSKLKRAVDQYLRDFGKLAEAYEVCRVGKWTDYRLYSAILAIAESEILIKRQRRPPPREVPRFRDGDIVPRLEQAFSAVVGIFGHPDINKIYEASCAAEEGLSIEDAEDLLVSSRLMIRLPIPQAPPMSPIPTIGEPDEQTLRAS